MLIAVAIPTLNEQESIADVVRAIPRNVVDHIIVADGGSSDQTREEAARAGADVINAGRGYGRARGGTAPVGAPLGHTGDEFLGAAIARRGRGPQNPSLRGA